MFWAVFYLHFLSSKTFLKRQLLQQRTLRTSRPQVPATTPQRRAWLSWSQRKSRTTTTTKASKQRRTGRRQRRGQRQRNKTISSILEAVSPRSIFLDIQRIVFRSGPGRLSYAVRCSQGEQYPAYGATSRPFKRWRRFFRHSHLKGRFLLVRYPTRGVIFTRRSITRPGINRLFIDT